MHRIKAALIPVLVFFLSFSISSVRASYIYSFEIFTTNGIYYDSTELDTYVVVSDGSGEVNFTFYNESLITSSIAGIYFDNGSLLGISSITEGPGTAFTQPDPPGELPNGNDLVPPFETTNEFCIEGDPPPSHNGVNPVDEGQPLEWVTVTFDLINGGTLEGVIDELNSGMLRIGIHITALPDGSSESAIAVPEPTSLLLFGLGLLTLIFKRKS